MKDLRFHPATLSGPVGRTVTWRNDDTVDHNVTATKGGRFHSRAFGAGGTYRFTPERTGVVDYVCTLHPGMNGTLLVTRK
jgi:plastocyanin